MDDEERKQKLTAVFKELHDESEKARELKAKKFDGWTLIEAPGELSPCIWKVADIIGPSLKDLSDLMGAPWVYGPRAKPMLLSTSMVATQFGIMSPEGTHFSFYKEWARLDALDESKSPETWMLYSRSSDFELVGQWLANAFGVHITIIGDDPDVKNRYKKSFEFDANTTFA